MPIKVIIKMMYLCKWKVLNHLFTLKNASSSTDNQKKSENSFRFKFRFHHKTFVLFWKYYKQNAANASTIL